MEHVRLVSDIKFNHALNFLNNCKDACITLPSIHLGDQKPSMQNGYCINNNQYVTCVELIKELTQINSNVLINVVHEYCGDQVIMLLDQVQEVQLELMFGLARQLYDTQIKICYC
jgi:hypothetical protein